MVIGAGNLGRVVADYADFSCRDFSIKVISDNDLKAIGSRIGTFVAAASDKIHEVIRRRGIGIGIISVAILAAPEIIPPENVPGIGVDADKSRLANFKLSER